MKLVPETLRLSPPTITKRRALSYFHIKKKSHYINKTKLGYGIYETV